MNGRELSQPPGEAGVDTRKIRRRGIGVHTERECEGAARQNENEIEDRTEETHM